MNDPDRKTKFHPSRVSPKIKTRVEIVWSKDARQSLQNVFASNSSSRPFHLFSVRDINSVARRALRQTVCRSIHFSASSARSQDFEVALRFVGNEEMRGLNARYRGKNKTTDVLSFAQDEGEAFPDFGEAITSLGDVVISVETAQRQADERGHSLAQEIEFLGVHGALHLLGFDHGNVRDRRKMWKQQDVVMEALGSTLLVSPST